MAQTKGVSIFPKNWKNFGERFETSFLPKKNTLRQCEDTGLQGGRQGLPAYFKFLN
jgi:hypothetical protein